MYKLILFISLIASTNTVYAQYPDGTLVLSSKKGLVGRIAKRVTGGDQYTHIGIIIDNKLYESDWPRAKVGPITHKLRTTNDYYYPNTPYTAIEIDAMRNKAKSLVGRPYNLRNYRIPGSKKTYGTWCSPFVGQVLNASGRYNLSSHDYYEPQNVINNITNDYNLRYRVYR